MTVSTAPRLEIQTPQTKASAVKKGAVQVAFRPFEHVAGGVGHALAIAWIPPGLLLGTAYGALAGVSEDELRPALLKANQFQQECDFESGLASWLTNLAAAEHQITLELVSHTTSAEVCRKQSSERSHDNTKGYEALGQQGVTRVIELKVIAPSLEASNDEAVNSRMALAVHVRARLLKLTAGRAEELGYRYYRYKGDKQKFMRWMADDAARLRAEVEKCQWDIAGQILEAFAE